MIKKVYAFNDKGETLLKRQYASTLNDTTIRGCVLSNPDCNFVKVEDTIIYRRMDTLYVSFVVEHENEMYILSLISHLMHMLEQKLGVASDSTIIYNFKDCHVMLDAIILNGKFIIAGPAEVMRCIYRSNKQ